MIDQAAPSAAVNQEADAGAGQPERTLVWWALGVAVLSRLVILAIGFLARSTLPVLHPRGAVLALPSVLYRGVLGRLLDGWTNSDAAWYLNIAQHGYVHRDSEAFLPLYPLLVHLLAGSGMGYVPAGIALALACFVAAAMLLYRLTADALGERTALWTVVFLSIAPTSFFFSAIYTESLFLFGSVALFFFAQCRQWLVAGLAGLLATLTRSAGLVLAVPLLLFYLQSVDWQWRRIRAGILSMLLVPCGLTLYMVYLWSARGDPLLFAKAQRHWHRYFAAPYVTVWQGVRCGYLGAAHLLAHDSLSHLSALAWQSSLDLVNLSNLVALVVVAGLMVLGWRRLAAPYNAYALLALLFLLFNPARAEPLMSLPRLALVVFPLLMALATATQKRPLVRALVVSLCLVGLAWLTARFVLFAWVA
ncbi:MAG: mannosyltransferase family protein [Thermoleophilia bacterium]